MKRSIRTLALLLIAVGLHDFAAAAPKSPVRYRGFTVASLDKSVLQEAAERWNANQVRYMMCPVWRAPNRAAGCYQATWQKMVADLPAGLDNARALGLAVVLDLHQVPNDNVKQYSKDGNEDSRLWWHDPENLKIMIDCWRQIAQICKNRDQVIWFDLYNEPLDWTVVHTPRSFPPKWPEWAQKVTDEIRKIDRIHPVAVESGPGMLSWGFKDFPPIKDPFQEVIYSVHPYQPVIYTHQGVNDTKVYAWPGEFNDHGGGWWDRKRLEVELAPAIEFQKKYHVRMWVGEFSGARWAPNVAGYLRDEIEVFEKLGWDWNYHALREAGVWCLDSPEEVDLYDAKGNYVRTGMADPKDTLRYAPYCTPDKGKAKPPAGLTSRGRVLKQYLDRNPRLIRKVLIIGNSITRHGASPAIGWPYNCGMAATSEDKDFAHVLYKKIVAAQPELKPELQLAYVADESRMRGFEHLVPCTADLVIVELGDNFRGKANLEELQKPYEAMLAGLQKGHWPRVYCLSAWGNPALTPWIKAAAANQNATFIEIGHLFNNPANRAGSEGHFKHGGVNWHPGNRGMHAIADTIWQVIR
jgi:hypothetical protein